MLPLIIDIHAYADGASAEKVNAATKAFLESLRAAGVVFHYPPKDPEKPTEEERFAMATVRHAYAVKKMVTTRYVSQSGPQPGTEQEHPSVQEVQVTENLLTGETRGEYKHMQGM
jgi:hypothetical protein